MKFTPKRIYKTGSYKLNNGDIGYYGNNAEELMTKIAIDENTVIYDKKESNYKLFYRIKKYKNPPTEIEKLNKEIALNSIFPFTLFVLCASLCLISVIKEDYVNCVFQGILCIINLCNIVRISIETKIDYLIEKINKNEKDI